jgi:hypothetical protein
VVTIPLDLPLPEVDLTAPRGDPDEALDAVAQRYGLTGATRRLVASLKRPSRQ